MNVFKRKGIFVGLLFFLFVFASCSNDKDNKNIFKVTFFDHNDNIIEIFNVKKNESVNPPNLIPIEGYAFVYWDTDYSKVVRNLEIRPVYEAKIYEHIFYDEQGVIIHIDKAKYGSIPDIPTIQIDGHEFIGWDKTLNELDNQYTYIPTFEKLTYLIEFFDFENKLIKSEKVEFGEKAISPYLENTDRYEFISWNKSFDYITEDLKIYPNFNINEKDHQYIFRGLNDDLIDSYYDYKNMEPNYPNPPLLDGYDFIGWVLEEVNQFETIYKANYKNLLEEFTVNFYNFDNQIIKTYKSLIGEPLTIKFSIEDNVEYYFKGWDQSLYNIMSDLDVYPIKEKRTYLVSFLDINGYYLYSEEVFAFEDASDPDIPDQLGYRFIGFSDSYKNVQNNVTVKFNYELIISTLYLYDKEENLYDKIEVNYFDSYDHLIGKEYEDYTFVKWDVELYELLEDTHAYPIYKQKGHEIFYYDENNQLLHTEIVKNNENGTYNEFTPKPGYYFAGWFPQPVNVRNNMAVKVLVFNLFSITDNTITKLTKEMDEIDIPEVIDGVVIKKIGYNAFRNTSVKSIKIPKTIEEIGGYAFSNMPNLVEVIFDPNINIKRLENELFANSPNLTDFIIPKSVNHLGNYLFKNNGNIKDIFIDINIESLGVGTFAYLPNLMTVNFHENTKIDTLTSYIFAYSPNLEIFEIPSTIKKLESGFIKGNPFYKEIIVSDQYQYISPYAFTDLENLKVLFFEDSNNYIDKMKTIDLQYNDNPNLQYLRLPNYLDDIASRFLYKHDSIREIILSEYIRDIEINKEAFMLANKINNFTFIDGITSIDENAFNGTSNISNIIFSDQSRLIHIGNGAFNNIPSLKKITLPNSIVTLGFNLFEGSDNINEMIIPFAGTTRKSNDYRNKINLSNINLLTIIDQTTIPSGVFKNVENIKEIVLPNNLEVIENLVFNNMVNLEIMDLPKSLIKIGSQAFGNTYKYIVPDLSNHNNLREIGNYAFFGNLLTEKFNFPKDLLSYGNDLFSKTTSIKELTLPYTLKGGKNTLEQLGIDYPIDSITITGDNNIEDYAFNEALVNEINITGNPIEIGIKAFRETKLTEIIIPESVQIIRDNAFNNTLIEKIIIPKNVRYIDYGAFFNNNYLKEVVFDENSNLEFLGDFVFSSSNEITEIILPKSIVSMGNKLLPTSLKFLETPFVGKYRGAKGDDSKLGMMAPDGLTLDKLIITDTNYIDSETFQYLNNKLVTEVILPSGLTKIEDYLFRSLQIHKVYIPNTVTEIGNYAFGSSSIKNINYQENSKLNKIGNAAFISTWQLEEYNVSKYVKEIGDQAFYNSNINTFEFESSDTLLRFGEQAFSNIINLSSFKIPTSLTEIPNNAFENNNLEEIIIPATIEKIGSRAFKNSNKITNIFIPRNINEIGDEAFYNSKNLNNFEFESNNNLLIFGAQVLSHSSIESLEIPNSVNEIKQSSFIEMHSLKYLKTPYLETLSDFTSKNYIYEIHITKMQIVKPNWRKNYIYNMNIRDIYFSEHLTNIGDYAFKDASPKISNIYIDPKAKLDYIGESAFENSELIDLILPESIKIIGSRAFSNNKITRSLNINEDLESLGSYAFSSTMFKEVLIDEYSSLEKILEFTFYNSKNQKISLPNTITEIERFAFRNSSVEEIISKSLELKIIGDYAFDQAANIKTINLGNKLISLGRYAFSETASLVEINIPNTLEVINKFTFLRSNINYLNIEEESNLSLIDDSSFKDSKLVRITLPNSLIKLGIDAFMNTSQLESINLPSSIEFIGSQIFTNSAINEVVIDNDFSLERFSSSMFSNTYNLKDFTIPDSIKLLDNGQFFNSAIEYLHIPKNIEFISDTAIANMRNLVEVTVDLENEYYKSIDGILYNFNLDNLIVYPSKKEGLEFIIDSSINKVYAQAFRNTQLERIVFDDDSQIDTIENNLFRNSIYLKDVILPKSLIKIENYAFAGTTNLLEINIPDKVLKIYENVFDNSGITNINFGENSSLDSFGAEVFANTFNMKEFTVPNTINSISNGMFLNSSIRRVYLHSDVNRISSNAFRKSSIEDIIFLEENNVSEILTLAFSETNNLKTFEFSDSIEEISVALFENAIGLEEIFIPKNIKTINRRAFYYSNLKNIVFDDEIEITLIDSHVFSNTLIEKITIPEGVTNIDFSAFSSSTIEMINLPSTLEFISQYAFSNTPNLINIFIPKNVVSIAPYVFSNSAITNITFESNSSIESIGFSSFKDTYNLIDFKLPKSVLKLGSGLFQNSSITNFEIESGSQLNYLSNNMFENTHNITEFTVPNQIKFLDSYIFKNSSITNIIFEEGTSIEELGSNIFEDTKNLKSFTLPKTVISYGYNMFYNSEIEFIDFSKNNNITKIGNDSFKNIEKLEVLILPQYYTEIGSNAFVNLPNLPYLIIPEYVRNIGSNAFSLNSTQNVYFETWAVGYSDNLGTANLIPWYEWEYDLDGIPKLIVN